MSVLRPTLCYVASTMVLSMYLFIIFNSQVVGKLDQISIAMPSCAAVYFGCYCLMKLGRDLITFMDYPKELENLNVEIHDAKRDLMKIIDYTS